MLFGRYQNLDYWIILFLAFEAPPHVLQSGCPSLPSHQQSRAPFSASSPAPVVAPGADPTVPTGVRWDLVVVSVRIS